MTINFFKRFILKSDKLYEGELSKPKITIIYLLKYMLCKLNYFYIRYIYNFNNQNNLK